MISIKHLFTECFIPKETKVEREFRQLFTCPYHKGRGDPNAHLFKVRLPYANGHCVRDLWHESKHTRQSLRDPNQDFRWQMIHHDVNLTMVEFLLRGHATQLSVSYVNQALAK